MAFQCPGSSCLCPRASDLGLPTQGHRLHSAWPDSCLRQVVQAWSAGLFNHFHWPWWHWWCSREPTGVVAEWYRVRMGSAFGEAEEGATTVGMVKWGAAGGLGQAPGLSCPTLPWMIRKKPATAMGICAGAVGHPSRTWERSAGPGAAERGWALVAGTRLQAMSRAPAASASCPVAQGTVTKFGARSRTSGQSCPGHALRGVQNLHPQAIGQPLLLRLDPSHAWPALPAVPQPCCALEQPGRWTCLGRAPVSRDGHWWLKT